MLIKLCRDGLLLALMLYLSVGAQFDFDPAQWPIGLRWGLSGTWLLLMVCLISVYRERAQRENARFGKSE